jgi:hypothetical protein
MTRKHERIRVYTVVEVWRGIADGARSFLDADKARRYLGSARGRRNLLEDDVRLFEGTITLTAAGKRLRSRSQNFNPIPDR